MKSKPESCSLCLQSDMLHITQVITSVVCVQLSDSSHKVLYTLTIEQHTNILNCSMNSVIPLLLIQTSKTE